MAAVVMAEHVVLGERVAIKFLHPRVAANGESLQRFLREARISSLVKCEHVVRTLDVGMSADGLSYLVMEYLEGEDLSARLARTGAFPIALATDCVLQAAEALSLAHAAGVVHRDIKPSNLWLSSRRDGSPLLKVLDFGISKLAPAASSDPSLTETTSVFGSPTYMSPEQIRSAKRVDARADVWALGVVLHELLTAQLPFQGDNVGGILASITADAPGAVRAVRPEVPVVLEDVVFACLEKDAGRRISLAELCAELLPFASDAGKSSAQRVLAVPTPASAPSSSEWRIRSTRAAVVGASTLSAATIRMPPHAVRRSRVFVGGAAVTLLAGGVLFFELRRAPSEVPIVATAAAPSVAALAVAASVASVVPIAPSVGHPAAPHAAASPKAPLASPLGSLAAGAPVWSDASTKRVEPTRVPRPQPAASSAQVSDTRQ